MCLDTAGKNVGLKKGVVEKLDEEKGSHDFEDQCPNGAGFDGLTEVDGSGDANKDAEGHTDEWPYIGNDVDKACEETDDEGVFNTEGKHGNGDDGGNESDLDKDTDEVAGDEVAGGVDDVVEAIGEGARYKVFSKIVE